MILTLPGPAKIEIDISRTNVSGKYPKEKKRKKREKIHFLPHKRSEIGSRSRGWKVSKRGGFPVHGRDTTGLPRNKRLRRKRPSGETGPLALENGRGGGGGGGCPLLIYSILAEYGRRARREREKAGAATGMNVFNSSGALVDAVSFDRQLLGVQWGAEAAAQCRARHNRVKLYMHVRVRLGTRSIHRVNGIGIRNSNTIYARV